MKKVKLTTSLKAGFSLVEMLVVIAIIGIIAAIAIPNIGSINDSAKKATAQRNAQSVASIMNAALAAGYVPTPEYTSGAEVVAAAVAGVEPTSGPFRGKKFIVPNISAEDQAAAAAYLTYNTEDDAVYYQADALAVEAEE
ncbi:prepilin-type N-terminal cleavage/methylation domain-containing protein [Prosthecobacter fusiformis]|uniref:Prepilin-type N-terminal cleavage/methylation domain-containing protein n=1 Tax=Prosthecobacter fusiformis TaxID=48464 RepID=A0A4R7S6N6_9BACT|nr:prepilin-type N-terminal cleavage/methylation domain-containing protein [Prosthecobacter fusiformis]TDU73228.1 prepilin-type N-terminal cleavage/methylation domain-containing protein [Prosthecobacter fusiformis]